MSNGTQTPEEILDGLAGQVRFFVDQEIPNVAAWNENPTVIQTALGDIGDFFTDVYGQLGSVTGAAAEWIPWPSVAYVSPTQFTVGGDQRATIPVGTRVRVHLGLQLGIAAVTTVAYDGVSQLTTITIDQSMLTVALAGVDYGFVRTSVPKIGPNDLQILAVNTVNIVDGAVTNQKIGGLIDQSKIGNAPWTLTAGELLPTDATTYPAIGRSTVHIRLQENGTAATVFGTYVNMRWTGTTLAQETPTRPSWLQQFDLPTDKMVVSRAAGGSTTFTDLFTLTASEALVRLTDITIGSGTVKARWGDVGNGDYQWRTNSGVIGSLPDDTSKAGWALRMGPSADDFSVFRAPAASGASQFTQLFRIDKNLALSTNRIQAGNTPNGFCVLNPGAGHPGYLEFYKNDGNRAGFLGWEYGTGQLQCFTDTQNGFRALAMVAEFCEVRGRRHGFITFNNAGPHNLDDTASLIGCDCTNSAVWLVLPAAGSCVGRIYYIFGINASSANPVVVVAQQNEYISGSNTFQLTSNRAKAVIVSVNWWDHWFRLF